MTKVAEDMLFVDSAAKKLVKISHKDTWQSKFQATDFLDSHALNFEDLNVASFGEAFQAENKSLVMDLQYNFNYKRHDTHSNFVIRL